MLRMVRIPIMVATRERMLQLALDGAGEAIITMAITADIAMEDIEGRGGGIGK